MTDHGIIFSALMVKALRYCNKTQTRRLSTSPLMRVQPGDRLWVRETFGFWSEGHDCELTFSDGMKRQTGPNTGEIPDASLPGYFKMVDRSTKGGPHRVNIPAIHMPRWASRLSLIVDSVRVESLHAISEEDAEAEGCVWDSADGHPVWYVSGAGLPHTATAVECYRGLWGSLHIAEGQRWQDDPEVLVLTFHVEGRT